MTLSSKAKLMSKLKIVQFLPRGQSRRDPNLELIICPECNGTTMVEIKVGMFRCDDKTEGGTDQVACFDCLVAGKKTILD